MYQHTEPSHGAHQQHHTPVCLFSRQGLLLPCHRKWTSGKSFLQAQTGLSFCFKADCICHDLIFAIWPGAPMRSDKAMPLFIGYVKAMQSKQTNSHLHSHTVTKAKASLASNVAAALYFEPQPSANWTWCKGLRNLLQRLPTASQHYCCHVCSHARSVSAYTLIFRSAFSACLIQTQLCDGSRTCIFQVRQLAAAVECMPARLTCSRLDQMFWIVQKPWLYFQ